MKLGYILFEDLIHILIKARQACFEPRASHVFFKFIEINFWYFTLLYFSEYKVSQRCGKVRKLNFHMIKPGFNLRTIPLLFLGLFRRKLKTLVSWKCPGFEKEHTTLLSTLQVKDRNFTCSVLIKQRSLRNRQILFQSIKLFQLKWLIPQKLVNELDWRRRSNYGEAAALCWILGEFCFLWASLTCSL